jgi:hypothetical protein
MRRMDEMEFIEFAGYYILLPLPEAEEWKKVRPYFDWKNATEEAVWLYEHGKTDLAEAMSEAPDFFALRDNSDLAKVEELLDIAPELRKGEIA